MGSAYRVDSLFYLHGLSITPGVRTRAVDRLSCTPRRSQIRPWAGSWFFRPPLTTPAAGLFFRPSAFGGGRLGAAIGAGNAPGGRFPPAPHYLQICHCSRVQRPGSTQEDTEIEWIALHAGTMRSLPMTRSCFPPPVTISPASRISRPF